MLYSYSAFSDIIEEQAKKQGLTLGKDAELLEKIKHTRLMLEFNDIITDKQADQIALKKTNEISKGG